MTLETINLRLESTTLNEIDNILKSSNVAKDRTDLIRKSIQLYLSYSKMTTQSL